ncbi:unnamed protein product [Mytilus edulis]|uniref:Fibronectin type-III domain-containing protein n=1 Tax=Mytilus edulis TaxID=6550 RepID=A0A8S3S8S4_MYTED|nr:unnamed protein product [Mytilus edulis]
MKSFELIKEKHKGNTFLNFNQFIRANFKKKQRLPIIPCSFCLNLFDENLQIIAWFYKINTTGNEHNVFLFSSIHGDIQICFTHFSDGSVVVEITFISEGFSDEKVLHDTLVNAFKTKMNGPYTIQLKEFWLKRLNDPSPPQLVKALNVDNGVLVSWKKPIATFFKTKEYVVAYTIDDWKSKEEITVPVDINACLIIKVLPYTKIQVKVYTCICHSFRSSPSLEVSTVVKDFSKPERENYQRLSELITNVAYRVIKEIFYKEYPASVLGKLMLQNKQILEEYLTEDQIKKLHSEPKTGDFDNLALDVHMLLVMFVCFKGWISIKSHTNQFPTKEDSYEKSDLIAIEFCITQFEERKENTISAKEFESLWHNVSEVSALTTM